MEGVQARLSFLRIALKDKLTSVTLLPPPTIPWQITGNHWVALPCIHPADASVHAVGVLHRASRAAIELAGAAGFADGTGPALLRPVLTIGGVRHELSDVPIAWERALGWIPTFTCTIADVVVRGTIFAPYGRDADVPGAVYALTLESRRAEDVVVDVTLGGTFAHRQLRVRTPRPGGDSTRVVQGASGAVLLEGSAAPGLVAVALTGDGDGTTTVSDREFSINRTLALPAQGRAQIGFYLAVGPEHDGAEATATVLRRRGWRDLLAATRDALQSLEQSTTHEALDRLINRNLLFAYFYAVGRALDDAQYYLVRTRVPWNGIGVTVRDWEALSWTLAAVQLADQSLARELLLRMCELHGYAPGRGVHYLDGTLFEPGFALEGVAAYPLAVERYIRDSGDDRIVDEPVLADTLYLSSEDLDARRDSRVPLYSTEVSPSGEPVPHPFTLHANAAAAQALDVLRRTLDEETARGLEDPEAVRAAITRHFVLDQSGQARYATSIDLAGAATMVDDPAASAFWLPLYDAVSRQDSTFRRTVRGIDAPPHALTQQCARLLGPDASSVLQWLRRAPLDGGTAAEIVDADGRAVANGGDAALSGLLAWCVWYAVNALGERP